MPLSILSAVANRPELRDELAGGALALVRAKCLYALEVGAGERPGPTATRPPCATRSERLRSSPGPLPNG